MAKDPRVLASASRAYRRALGAWTGAIGRFAWPVVAAAVALSVLAAVHLAANFSISTDTGKMLSPELPFQKLDDELDAAFPQDTGTIAIVVDGETPDLADDAARRLAAALAGRTDTIRDVFDPAGGEFLRRNGFLYLDLGELHDLSDRLAEAQPFLGTLWRDPSLVGLFGMLHLAIEEFLKDPGKRPVEIARVIDAVAAVAEAQARGEFGELSWRELMSGEDLTDAADRRRIVVVQPVLDFSSLSPAARPMAAIRGIARELGLAPEAGVRVRLTGSAALNHEELRSVEQGMGLAGVVSLTLVIGLLAVGLRSARLVLATLATLVMGLIWTAAFAILALGELNLISVAFAVLFIGLSVDFGIHYGLRYKEGIARGETPADALRNTATGIGGALTLCALGAAIAFYSFLPTDYLGLAELGLIAGTGMFIALVANMTVLPALLVVVPGGAGAAGAVRAPAAETGRGRFEAFVTGNARSVLIAALVLGVAAAMLLPRARFDFDPLNLKDPNTESVAAVFDLMGDSRTSPYTIEILAPDLEAAEALGARLEALPEVDGTATLADYVPRDQDAKLEVIEAMGLYLMPSFMAAGTGPAPTAEARLDAIRRALGDLGRLAAAGAGAEATAARRLLGALDGLFGKGLADAPEAKVKEFETRLLSALPGRIEALNEALSAEPVTLESLPAAIRERNVAADGRALVRVSPKEDMTDRRALERFVRAVRAVAPNATGAPVIILEAGDAVVRAFWQAGAISVVLISVLLMARLGRVRGTVLVFAPLVLAALLTVAASVLLDLPFNFANVIVLPLLFGLGVASGIHLVARGRDEAGVAGVFATSTPRAVVFSALTTVGSFASIAISSHRGTASMGLLLTIAIVLTLVCTLVVLPALMTVFRAGGETGR